MILNIVTRCTRPQNLYKMRDSVLGVSHGITVKWHIIFDTRIVSKIETDLFESLTSVGVSFSFRKSEKGDYGHQFLNEVHNSIPTNEWMYVLDDDNIIHPDFYETISKAYEINEKAEAFVFSQKVDKKDFTGLDVRVGLPANMKVQHVDMAQIVFEKNECRFLPNQYTADGVFIEELFNKKPEKFSFLPMVLCYYNFLEEKMNLTLPKILLISEKNVEIKSTKHADWESDQMCVLWKTDENEIVKIISEFEPHVIVSVGKTFFDFPALYYQSWDVSKRWIHYTKIEDVNGEEIYNSVVKNTLNPSDTPQISVFTSAYNSGEKLIRAYNSMKAQNEQNWEWVIVNDGEDKETSAVLRMLQSLDTRVKVFEFSKKTKGIIGEAKYRAACMTSGTYLIELDHDDSFTANAFQEILFGFVKFPDAGFLYSDCVEIDENYNCLNYGEGFAFNYGYLRDEIVDGKMCKINVTPNINPKTVRHIVGVPNHLRCWKREVYFAIGGHNRKLSIADDYELIVRTFLHTKFVKVDKTLYYQHYHNSNTQNSTRADIQRRVRSVANYYNEPIKNRFEELGVEDWAYKYNSQIPLLAPSKTGDEEKYVNYICT